MRCSPHHCVFCTNTKSFVALFSGCILQAFLTYTTKYAISIVTLLVPYIGYSLHTVLAHFLSNLSFSYSFFFKLGGGAGAGGGGEPEPWVGSKSCGGAKETSKPRDQTPASLFWERGDRDRENVVQGGGGKVLRGGGTAVWRLLTHITCHDSPT